MSSTIPTYPAILRIALGDTIAPRVPSDGTAVPKIVPDNAAVPVYTDDPYDKRARALIEAIKYLADNRHIWEAAERLYGSNLTEADIVRVAKHHCMVRALGGEMRQPFTRASTKLSALQDGTGVGLILLYVRCLRLYIEVTPNQCLGVCVAIQSAYAADRLVPRKVYQLVSAGAAVHVRMIFMGPAAHQSELMGLAREHYGRPTGWRLGFSCGGAQPTYSFMYTVDKLVPVTHLRDEFTALHRFIAGRSRKLARAIGPFMPELIDGTEFYAQQMMIHASTVEALCTSLMFDPMAAQPALDDRVARLCATCNGSGGAID